MIYRIFSATRLGHWLLQHRPLDQMLVAGLNGVLAGLEFIGWLFLLLILAGISVLGAVVFVISFVVALVKGVGRKGDAFHNQRPEEAA